MRTVKRSPAILLIMIILFTYASIPTAAAPMLEETRILLQKSLTLHEIDQEVSRLTQEEKEIARQVTNAEQDIEQKKQHVAATRKHAGNVLRAQYMGARSPVLYLLLSSRSLSEATAVLEYVRAIVQKDKLALKSYADAQQELQQVVVRLKQTQTELAEIKARFLARREQALKLQQELDKELAALPETEQIKEEIRALTADWENKGLPLFKTYFEALGSATKQLPELFSNKDNFSSNGLNFTFQISDVQLNEFLRQKNELFHSFSFRFEGGTIIASGNQDAVEATIKGRYVLEETPKNAIRYRVEELSYNGFILPDTTGAALEKEFELVLYPQNYASAFQSFGLKVNLLATGVFMQENKFVLQLKAVFPK